MAIKRKSKDPMETGAAPALQKVIEAAEGEIVKAMFIGEEAPPPKSKALEDGDKPFSGIGGLIEPPISLDLWARMMEINTRLGRSIRTYARNTVGMGWEVAAIKPVTPETDAKTKEKIVEQTARIEALFKKPNTKMPYVTLAYLEKVDEEATGNGYYEVVRNVAGKIAGLYHISAVSVRLRKGGGFVQVRNNKKRFFKEFGDPRIVDADDGKVLVDAKGNKTAEGLAKFGAGAVPLESRASELLHFKVYSPRSTYYGLPRYMAAAPAISGSRLAATRNVSFFENDAVPRVIITVSGGRLTHESIQMLEKFVTRKGKLGPGGAHRIAVLQVEEKQIGGLMNKNLRTQINVQPLTVGSSEDASFQNYRSANDEEIREAFGLAQVFFSANEVNKSSAFATMAVTNDQEFEPDRIEKEFIINATIVADLLEGEEPLVAFYLKRPALTDPLDQARIDQVYASLGALTPNELRERIGEARFPASFAFADKPLQIAMTELSLGAAIAIRSMAPPQRAEVKPPPGVEPEPTVGAPGTPVGATGLAPRPASAGAPQVADFPKELDFMLDLAHDIRRFALQEMELSGERLEKHAMNIPVGGAKR